MLIQVDRLLRSLEARLRSRAALRLWARLRRRQGALLAGLLVVGIFLMVLHWAGACAAGQPLPPPPAAGAGPAYSAHAQATPRP